MTKLVTGSIAAKIDRILPPRFIANYAGDKIKDHLEDMIGGEMENLFNQLGDAVGRELQEQKLLGSLVEAKITTFNLVELESLVLKVAKNELRYIEVFGAVVGGWSLVLCRCFSLFFVMTSKKKVPPQGSTFFL